MGETSILYKNSNDEWITHHTIAENENISPRDEWEFITISISENNYGTKIKHNKKNSSNQMFCISKITLTYTI